MHFLCNEVPQDWNMMKKGTNTLGNVCVAIPPALPQRHSFTAFSQAMKSLWKVTFIPHLTRCAFFFLENAKINTTKPDYRDLHTCILWFAFEQQLILIDSLRIVSAPSSYGHFQQTWQIVKFFYSRVKVKVRIDKRENFCFYISLRGASLFSKLAQSCPMQPLSHNTGIHISYKVDVLGKLSWVLKEIIDTCLKLYPRSVTWRHRNRNGQLIGICQSKFKSFKNTLVNGTFTKPSVMHLSLISFPTR